MNNSQKKEKVEGEHLDIDSYNSWAYFVQGL